MPERIVLIVGGGTSLVLLIGALVMQYVWGMVPCALCMEQRWAHAVVVVVAAILLVIGRNGAKSMRVLVPLLMCVAIGAAARHALVEAGFLSASCVAGFSDPSDVDALIRGLPLLAEPSCADGPRILGMSIPLLNVLASSASLVVMLVLLMKEKFSCQPSSR